MKCTNSASRTFPYRLDLFDQELDIFPTLGKAFDTVGAFTSTNMCMDLCI